MRCVDVLLQTGYEDIYKLNSVLTTVEVRRSQLYTVNPLKIKMLQCNIQTALSECGLNASFTSTVYFVISDEEFSSFSSDRRETGESVRRSGGEEVLK